MSSNAWDLVQKFFELQSDIDDLMEKKKESNKPWGDKGTWIDKAIDTKLNEQLRIKHKLQDIPVID